MKKINLKVKLGQRIILKNPVVLESGCFGYGEEYRDLIDINRVGAIVTKTITLKPRAGNLPPRLVETAAGLLNSIGLANVGIELFLKEKLPYLKKFSTPVIVSIAGEGSEEYLKLVQILNKEKIAGIELNISCPNIKKNLVIAQDEVETFNLVKAVRKKTELPLLVKLSPNVTDITRIAKSAEKAGADILSLVNTFSAMGIDSETGSPRLGGVVGGLSGPAIKPIALRMVWQVRKATSLPIIGAGGILSCNDALEFIIAGANAVGLGTAIFVNPHAYQEIITGLKKYLFRKAIYDVNELVGSLHEN
ncbi:MAG: dihydroorotate dehydrogenase [Candidatus Omnitrophica bacterium]|nr:dihydroorotate dehydrogenase [Candidatus Omnitrophota bacterium]